MRIIAILSLLMGLSINTFAQEEENTKERKNEKRELSPEQRADKRTEKMTEVLGLSADQKDEIKAINLAHAVNMDEIKTELKVLKKRAKEQRQQTKKEIDSVLTKEQKDTLETEKEKHKEEKERRRKERCCQENE